MAYSWKVLANDWSALTDTEKEALFVWTNYNKPTVAELQSLGNKFKIVAYDVDTAVPKTVVKAVPNNKLFVPVNLFGASFRLDFKSVPVTNPVYIPNSLKAHFSTFS